MSLRSGLVIGTAVVVTVAAAVVAVRVFSPSGGGDHRRDDQRVSDLRDLQNLVNVYRARKKHLPDTLDGALKELSWPRRAVDPVSSAPYEYRRIDDTMYQLCATFDRGSEQAPPMYGEDPFWAHTSARQCFSLTSKEPAATGGK